MLATELAVKVLSAKLAHQAELIKPEGKARGLSPKAKITENLKAKYSPRVSQRRNENDVESGGTLTVNARSARRREMK